MKHLCKLALPLLTAFGVFLYAITTTPVHAVQGTIYFSPASAAYAPGQTFTVEIRANVPANTSLCGGATISVAYPTNILQATAASSAGGALGGGDPSISNGTVAYSRFMCPSQAVNNQKIFTITFRALTTGTATLNFAANTNINDGPTTRQPATFTVATPTCPTGQTGTPPNCTTPTPVPPTPAPSTPAAPANNSSTPATPNTPKPTQPQAAQAPAQPSPPVTAPIPPTITDDTAVASRDTADITWQTHDATATSVRYGTSADTLEFTGEITSDGDSHSTTLQNLQLGTTYFYAIDAKNASDNKATKPGRFTTKAYPVVLRVMQGTNPLANAQVSLKGHDGSHTTTRKGEVALDLLPGNYTMQLTVGAQTTSQSFTVQKIKFAAGTTPDTQIVTVKLTATAASTTASNQPPWLLITLVLTGLFVAAGVTALLFWRRRRATQAAAGYTSIIEDYPAYPQPSDTPLITNMYAEQPLVSPTPLEAMNYQPPQPYTTPTYVPQPASYLEQVTAPTPEATEEPLDMWSAPPSSPQEIYHSDAVAQAAPNPPPLAMEPATPNPGNIPQPPSSAPQDIPTPHYQAAVEPNASQPISGIETETDDRYEYNEDNSMTIHHAR